MRQTSRGKFNRLQRATAGFTTSALDGYGLRGHVPARPAPYASYLVDCSSARVFAPRFLQTPPRGDALALRYHFSSVRLSRGLSPPEMSNMPGTHEKGAGP